MTWQFVQKLGWPLYSMKPTVAIASKITPRILIWIAILSGREKRSRKPLERDMLFSSSLRQRSQLEPGQDATGECEEPNRNENQLMFPLVFGGDFFCRPNIS